LRLTDEELRDVLTRTAELDRTARHGDAWNAEREAVIGAGEEIGLSRHAVERALMERLEFPASPPAVGSLTWARSADGRSMSPRCCRLGRTGWGSGSFAAASTASVSRSSAHCAFIPGERVACQWPIVGALDLHRSGLRHRQAACQAERRLGAGPVVSARPGLAGAG